MILGQDLLWRKAKPYDAEVEYLESSGTQYIDTGIVGVSPCSAKMTLAFTGNPSNEIVLGAANVADLATKALYILGQYPSAQNFTRFGNNYQSYGTITANAVSTYEITMSAASVSARINGVSAVSFAGTTEQNTGLNLYLFAINRSGVAQFKSSVKMYSCAISINGVLVADYIPVRVGQVGYLYDRVSGALFGNEGTGAFGYGADVVPVEYLESSGTQYIDTGFVPDDTCGIRIVSTPLAIADVVHVGCRSTTNGRWWVNYGSTFINAAWNTFANAIQYTTGQQYTIENNYKNSRLFAVNGTTYNTSLYESTLAATTHPAYIFAADHVGGALLKSTCKIASVQFTRGADIAMDFVPVRIGTEGALKDTLTRRFYRNAGTGDFTYGNDVTASSRKETVRWTQYSQTH